MNLKKVRIDKVGGKDKWIDDIEEIEVGKKYRTKVTLSNDKEEIREVLITQIKHFNDGGHAITYKFKE